MKSEDCQIIAFDCRAHGTLTFAMRNKIRFFTGATKTVDDSDLSIDTLVQDVASLVNQLFKDTNVPIILVGHSMGGAIAAKACPLIRNLAGLVVIDVVEGTALAALPAMQNILENRPKNFNSIEEAIQWR
jgi:protein phosphatase methylesterase 1